MRRVFITGTDTGIGKTRVGCAWLRELQDAGRRVAPMKPVASGANPAGENDDARALIEAAGGRHQYRQVNPYLYAPPIAPHIAAAEAGNVPDLHHLAHCARELEQSADLLLVEGAGGWMVPLSESLMMVDLVRALQAEVVLVVGMRLGCLNHAMLSERSILDDDVPLLGWIANWLEPEMSRGAENLATLRARMRSPFLGQLHHGAASLRWRRDPLA